jgi:hypothetical protein
MLLKNFRTIPRCGTRFPGRGGGGHSSRIDHTAGAQQKVISSRRGRAQQKVISSRSGRAQQKVISFRRGRAQQKVISSRSGRAQQKVISSRRGRAQQKLLSSRGGGNRGHSGKFSPDFWGELVPRGWEMVWRKYFRTVNFVNRKLIARNDICK